MSTETEPLKTEEEAKAYWEQLDAEERGEKPQPAPANQAAPEDKAGEKQPDAASEKDKEQKPDPWAGVPDIVRTTITGITEKLKPLDNVGRLERVVGGVVGRVGAIQSELARQQEELKRAGQAVAASSTSSPSKEQIAAAAANPAKWEKLKGDFPEWADGVAEYLEARLAALPKTGSDEALRREFESSKSVLTTLEQRVVGLAKNNEEMRELVVEMKHPGWKESINTDAFMQWYGSQPPEIRQLGASEYPLHAIRVLDLFAEHQKQQPDPEKVKREREERLQQAQSTRGSRGSAPVKRPEDMTEEEYWKHLEAQDRQQQAA